MTRILSHDKDGESGGLRMQLRAGACGAVQQRWVLVCAITIIDDDGTTEMERRGVATVCSRDGSNGVLGHIVSMGG